MLQWRRQVLFDRLRSAFYETERSLGVCVPAHCQPYLFVLPRQSVVVEQIEAGFGFPVIKDLASGREDDAEMRLGADDPDGILGRLVVGAHFAGLLMFVQGQEADVIALVGPTQLEFVDK